MNTCINRVFELHSGDGCREVIRSSSHRRSALALCAALMWVLISGCAVPNPVKDVAAETRQTLKSPSERPSVALTSFSEGLRCVDLLLLDFGVRNVSILVEDLDDQTKKVTAGTKDMLISAFQEATKRSRAVRLVAFGNDARNASTFLDRAQRQSQYQNVPDFGIRGSVSQFDDNVIKKSADAGFSIGDLLSAGLALSSSSKVMGVDLTAMRLEDFSVVPGVSSKNAIVILQQGSGTDASATIRKFNVNYQASTSRSEGTAIALRNLIELATIELLGRLVKVPYWRCLNAKDDDAEVKSEIADWFEGMAQSDGRTELFAYFQYHLSRLGLYEAEVNGIPNKELAQAVRRYRTVLGLSDTSDLNAELFAKHLSANRQTVRNKIETLLAELPANKPAVEATVSAAAATTNTIELRFLPSPTQTLAGAEADVRLSVFSDATIYCFLHDAQGSVMRLLPNAGARQVRVNSGQTLALRGEAPQAQWRLHVNEKGLRETVGCFASDGNLVSRLPKLLQGADFQAIPGVASLEEIRDLIRSAAGPRFGEAWLTLGKR